MPSRKGSCSRAGLPPPARAGRCPCRRRCGRLDGGVLVPGIETPLSVPTRPAAAACQCAGWRGRRRSGRRTPGLPAAAGRRRWEGILRRRQVRDSPAATSPEPGNPALLAGAAPSTPRAEIDHHRVHVVGVAGVVGRWPVSAWYFAEVPHAGMSAGPKASSIGARIMK